MPIKNPSQYECDQMEMGDIVFIKPRTRLYRFIRDHFYKDKLKIRVRDGWTEPAKYKTYYQEDCTLMFRWDVACMKEYKKCVPLMYSNSPKEQGYKTVILKSLNVGLYNIQIVFRNNKTLTIPTNWVAQGIKANENTLQNIKDERMINENLKFSNIKGQTFINIIKEKNIESWIPSYCTLCGNPVIFNFKEDKVVIENKCSCGLNKLNMNQLTYDEFALWYLTQVNDVIKKQYKKFWFDREM